MGVFKVWDGTKWVLVSGVQGPPAERSTGVYTTLSIGDGVHETGEIQLARSFHVYKVTVDRSAWVRLYQTAADRDADISRLITNDPPSGSGLVFEVYLEAAGELRLSPVPFGFNGEVVPTNMSPITVTNLSGLSSTVAVSIEFLGVE